MATYLPTQAARSDSDSPLPDWLSQHTSPAKPLEMLSDSDDAIDGDAIGDAQTNGSKVLALEDEGASHIQTGEQHAAEGLGGGMKGKRKATSTVLLSSEDDGSPLPKASSRQGAARKKQKSGAGKAAQAVAVEAALDEAAGPSTGVADGGIPDTQQASCSSPTSCRARTSYCDAPHAAVLPQYSPSCKGHLFLLGRPSLLGR